MDFTTDQWITLDSAAATVGLLLLVAYALLIPRRPANGKPRPWLSEKIAREPVAFAAVAGSIAAALVAFGVPLSEEQKTVAIAAIIGLATWLARRQVTPVSDPRLE